MKKYETTVIIDPALDQTKTLAVIKKYEEIILKDGEIIETEKWGKKRLTYQIKKKPTGFYVHFRYSAAPSIPELLEKSFLIDTSILRFMTIATDKRAEKQRLLDRNNVAAKADKKEETTETKK